MKKDRILKLIFKNDSSGRGKTHKGTDCSSYYQLLLGSIPSWISHTASQGWQANAMACPDPFCFCSDEAISLGLASLLRCSENAFWFTQIFSWLVFSEIFLQELWLSCLVVAATTAPLKFPSSLKSYGPEVERSCPPQPAHGWPPLSAVTEFCCGFMFQHQSLSTLVHCPDQYSSDLDRENMFNFIKLKGGLSIMEMGIIHSKTYQSWTPVTIYKISTFFKCQSIKESSRMPEWFACCLCEVILHNDHNLPGAF
jgi:hypothetical protein